MKTLGTVVCIGGLAAAGLALVPPANADSPMPDLDRYTTVNTDDYWVAIPTSGYPDRTDALTRSAGGAAHSGAGGLLKNMPLSTSKQ